MALTDLQFAYQGGSANLYVTLRNLSDYTVWNGSALASWSNGSIQTYAGAGVLTDQGGDLYTLAVPSSLPVGDYEAKCYESSGAPASTAAITDLLLDTQVFHWNGAALSSTSSITLSAYALTTLDDLKTFMGITASTYDTLLTLLINGVSAEIERIVGKEFKARDRRLWLNVARQERVILPSPPIQHITRVAWGSANGLALTYSGSAISAQASVYRDPESPDAGGLRLVTVSSAGVKTANNLAFASYPSLSTLATAASLISGWTATVMTDRPSYELRPSGGQNAKSRTVYLTYADQDIDGYRLDSTRGHLSIDWATSEWGWPEQCDGPRRFNRGNVELFIEMRNGFETIPEDVAMECRAIVKDKYSSRKQNTAVKSAALGPYSYTLRDDQAAAIRDRLSHYLGGGAFVGALV